MATHRLTPAQERQLLIGIVGVIVVVVWVNFFVIPQRRTLSEVSGQVHTLRAQVVEARQGLAQRPALEAEAARLAAEYELSADALPPEEQVPELLKAITEVAQASQVGLLTVRPKVDLGQITPGPSGYLELPIEIAASGGYHEIGTFLDALERSPSLLLRVQRFQIQPDPQDLWHHQALFVLQAYLISGAHQKG